MDNSNLQSLIENIEKVIVGKKDTIKLLLVGLLTNGHILIEDVPVYPRFSSFRCYRRFCL